MDPIAVWYLILVAAHAVIGGWLALQYERRHPQVATFGAWVALACFAWPLFWVVCITGWLLALLARITDIAMRG